MIHNVWTIRFGSKYDHLTFTRMTLKCSTWYLYQVITIRFIGFKTGISRVCIVFYDILLIELLSNFSFIHIVIRVICSTLSILENRHSIKRNTIKSAFLVFIRFLDFKFLTCNPFPKRIKRTGFYKVFFSRKQKKLAGAAAGSFATGSFGSTFQSKIATPQEPPPLPLPAPPSGGPYSQNRPHDPDDTDMFKEEAPRPKTEFKPEPKHETKQESDSDNDEYLDWKSYKCLLCRRAFADTQQLQKHVQKSKLHRENLEKTLHPPAGSDEEPEAESDAYRLVY